MASDTRRIKRALKKGHKLKENFVCTTYSKSFAQTKRIQGGAKFGKNTPVSI